MGGELEVYSADSVVNNLCIDKDMDCINYWHLVEYFNIIVINFRLQKLAIYWLLVANIRRNSNFRFNTN